MLIRKNETVPEDKKKDDGEKQENLMPPTKARSFYASEAKETMRLKDAPKRAPYTMEELLVVDGDRTAYDNYLRAVEAEKTLLGAQNEDLDDPRREEIQQLLWFKRWAEYKLAQINAKIAASDEAMQEVKEAFRTGDGEGQEIVAESKKEEEDLSAGLTVMSKEKNRGKRSRDDFGLDGRKQRPEFDSDLSLGDMLKKRTGRQSAKEGKDPKPDVLSGAAEQLRQAGSFEDIKDEEIQNDPVFWKLLEAKSQFDDVVVEKKPVTFTTMTLVAKHLSEAVTACDEAQIFLRPTVDGKSRKLFAMMCGISESLSQLAEGNGGNVLNLLYSLRRKQFVSSFGSARELGKWTAAGGLIVGSPEEDPQEGGQNRRVAQLPQDIRFRMDNLIAYHMALYGDAKSSRQFALYSRSVTGVQLRYEQELKQLLLTESDTFDHYMTEVQALKGKLNEKTGAAKGARETYELLVTMLGGDARDPGTLARFILTLNDVHIRWLFGKDGFNEWERIHGHLEADEDELENENMKVKSTEQKEVEFFKNRELNYRKLFCIYLAKQRQMAPHLIQYYRSLGVSLEIGG